MARIYPVIMSGGSGTRMWPLSRRDFPKQFLPLFGEQSLFQQTVERVRPGFTRWEVAPPTIICGQDHLAPVEAQLSALGIAPHAILLEPEGRNTAVVAGVAASFVQASDPAGWVLLLPADHHVADAVGFWRAVERGVAAVQSDHLVTLGIRPDRPETGFGYIQKGSEIAPDCYQVAAFKEKPDAIAAEKYVASDAYFWNAGIFFFGANAMLTELGKYSDDILQAGHTSLEAAHREGARIYLDPDTFARCRAQSIDYAVMEKTQMSAMVAPVDVGWSDIGSWSALSALQREEDSDTLAIGDIILEGCEGVYARSDGPLVAAIGVKDLIIVATEDAVLVMPPDRAQDVKQIIAQLKTGEREDLL